MVHKMESYTTYRGLHFTFFRVILKQAQKGATVMRSAFDFAKYLMKNGYNANTLDGNTKLQKLLTFANLIHLAKTGQPLFEEAMQAFDNGCVVEPVRFRYRYNYDGLLRESREFVPDFSREEYDSLEEAIKLFGPLSPRELSDLQHEFHFWQEANSQPGQCIALSAILPELGRVHDVLQAGAETDAACMKSEKINDIVFYYDPSFHLTERVVDGLYRFSLHADEPAYTIYEEDGELVVY